MKRCANNDELARILAEQTDEVPREVWSHVNECDSCNESLEELRQLLRLGGEYCAFLETDEADAPDETIDRIRRNTREAFRTAAQRERRADAEDASAPRQPDEPRRSRQPFNRKWDRLVAGAVGASLTLGLVFCVRLFSEPLNPRGGAPTDAFQASLVLWGGAEPAGTGHPAGTDRDEQTSRFGVLTSNRDGFFQILRVNGSRGVVRLANDDWNRCTALEPFLMPIAAPPDGVQNEWFVACIVAGEVPEGRLNSLSTSLNDAARDKVQSILVALDKASTENLQEDLSRQLTAAAKAECRVVISRWRVKP